MSERLMPDEKWVNGYEFLYSVTSGGEVFTHRRGTRKLMIGGLTRRKNKYEDVIIYRYRVVTLTDSDGCKKNHYVHRLVAMAFVPSVEGKNLVNHIDGVMSNNAASNLEWVTHSENMSHASDIGLMRNGSNFRVRESYIETKLHRGDTHRFLLNKYANETPDQLIAKHVPVEMTSVQKSHSNKSIIDDWIHFIRVFDICDSKMSLSQAARELDISPSMVSKIRNGKRLVDARCVYDKYRGDDYFYNFHKNLLTHE